MAGESGVIPVAEAPALRQVPLHLRYFSLLRANSNFRRLWMAQLVSEIGDWFYSLAVYDLLHGLTGSGQAVAWPIISQTLPRFLMPPLARYVADRFRPALLVDLAHMARRRVVCALMI